MQHRVEVGDVVEIIRHEQKWAVGCLAVVDGLYPWGITGYVPKPFLAHTGPTRVYIRAQYNQIHVVGPSLLKVDTDHDQPSEH